MERALAAALLATACGGLAPRPEDIAASEPPPAAVDPAGRQAVAALREEAVEHLAAGDWDAVLGAAEAMLEIDPRDAGARALRARCLMHQAQRQAPPALAAWRRAEGELRLAQRLDPRDPEAALAHAELLAADGHLSAAAAKLDGVLDHVPDHVGCLRMAAALHYDLAEERAAAPLLERLLELEPSDHAARFRLASCRLRLASTAIRERAEPAAALEGLAAAAAEFDRYRRLVPADAEGHAGAAFARLMALRVAEETPAPAELEAIAALWRTAARLAPSSPDHEFNLGVVCELRGDAEAAQSAYQTALARDPEHLPALLNLAASLAASGRSAAAIPLVHRALALNPTSSERRRLQAFLAEQAPS
jgi:tetratricopeptide (TPR) repeat protein